MISVTNKGNKSFSDFLNAIKNDDFKNDVISLYELIKDAMARYASDKDMYRRLSLINGSFENQVIYYDEENHCLTSCPLQAIRYKENPKMIVSLGRIIKLQKFSMLIEKIANNQNCCDEFYDEFKKTLIQKIILKQKIYMDLVINHKDVEIINASEKIINSNDKNLSDKILNTGFLYSPEDIIQINFLSLNCYADSYINYVISYFADKTRIAHLNPYFVKQIISYYLLDNKFEKVHNSIINTFNNILKKIVEYYYKNQKLKQLFNIFGGNVPAGEIIINNIDYTDIKTELPIVLSAVDINPKDKLKIVLDYIKEAPISVDRFLIINELLKDNIYSELLANYKIEVSISNILTMPSNKLLDFKNMINKTSSVYITAGSNGFCVNVYYDNIKNIQYLQDNINNVKIKFVYYYDDFKSKKAEQVKFVQYYIYNNMPMNEFSKLKKLHDHVINKSISGIDYDQIKYSSNLLELY